MQRGHFHHSPEVNSVDGLSGAITFTSNDATVTITKLGHNLDFSAVASGGVTTTGSPVANNLTKFSAANTITNGDLSGDVTTSGTMATTVAKIQGTAVAGTTGTGNVVFATGPTLSSPLVGTQSSTDNSTKAASTAYVTTAITNAIAAVNPAVAVQAATNAILPNSPTYSNGASGIGATITAGATNATLVVDGYTPALLERILVKNESSGGGLGAAKNGVYYVSQLAALGVAWVLTRALDYDQPSDINNTGAIPVISGTANASTSWVLTSQVATVGTDALTYTKFTVNPTTILTVGATTVGGTYLGDALTTAQTLVLVQYAAYAFTINSMRNLGTVSGTATGTLNINGTPVTGCSSLSLTSTPQDATASAANAVSIGDKITFVTSSPSSLTGLLAFSLVGTR